MGGDEAKRQEQAEALRELDEQVSRLLAELPSAPRWIEEKAVAKFIFRILDVWDYEDANRQAIYDYSDPPYYISFARKLVVDEASNNIPRKRGRPKMPPAERAAASLLPDAELLCLAILDLLEQYCPGHLRRDTVERAQKYTVQRIESLLGGKVFLRGGRRLTPKMLYNFMNYRPAGDYRRFGQPRPELKPKPRLS